ncbi:MAG: ABC transporter substrate-binding protein [Lachnospiraceae bacterium]
MKMRRVISLILAVILTAGITAGCKPQDEKKEEDTKDGKVTAKGRYVEQEIPLPEGAGEAIGIQNKDGDLVLYTRNGGACHSYTRSGEEWADSGDVAWMTDAADRLGLQINHIYTGRDGNIYGMALPCREGIPYGQHILRDAGDGSAQDCTPAPCLEVQEDGNTTLLVDMAVLENGVVGVGQMDGMIRFYQDGRMAAETESIPIGMDHQPVLAASKGAIAIYGKDGQSIDFYSADSYEKKNSVSVKKNLTEALITPGEEGIWYLADSEGIQRVMEEGSIVELMMEGTGTLMSTDSAWLLNFLTGADGEFYGLYKIQGGGHRLMCYQFDETAAAVRNETLSIYGLRENQTVSQAVYVFQSRHPEVKVDYQAAVTDTTEVPTADTIRALNAELLNGSGADVLMLDGLPVESYMEKGILADLSDLSKQLSDHGVLTDVIGNTAVVDQKVYGIPARVSVPVIFGEEGKVDACQNPDALHAYLNQNPGGRLFGATTHELAGMTLFNAFYEDLKTEKGSFDEEKMTQFLEDWMLLCEVQATKTIEEKTGLESGVWKQMRNRFNSAFGLAGNPVLIEEINGLMSSMVPYAMARESGKAVAGFKQYYIPQVIAGINASSKQQELAEEFIECLFEESVQKGDNADGFPVLRSALDYMAEYVETPEALEMSVGSGSEDPETGEEVHIDAQFPSKDEVNQLIGIIEGLKTPFMVDSMVADTVLAEMENCYTGKQTPRETAKAICQKVDTYLAE